MSLQTQTLKESAINFLNLAASGNVKEAYSRHISEDFKHHNGHFAGDANSLMTAMEDNAKMFPNKSLEVKNSITEGNQVAVLSCVKLNPGDLGIALVHIFRFEGNMIVELWDIAQAVPENSPNKNGMF